MLGLDIQTLLVTIPAIIIGLTFHEFAHAWVSHLLGDDTAKASGRVSLNPLVHIDPLGFLFIVFAGFGWAKPVMFDSTQLKHKHRDEILVALAGPVMNMLLTVLFFGIARILYMFPYFYTTDNGVQLLNVMITFRVMNLGLGLFNLIPIPPLDGSHIYMTFVQSVNPKLMFNLYRYGTLALFGILIIQNQFNITILPISSGIKVVVNFLFRVMQF